VKKAMSIILLSLYLLCGTEFRELGKLGAFVTHYFEHKENNKDLTLIEFIEIHYSQSNSKYNDYDKDMKLPFKSHNCSSHQAAESSYLSSINYYIQEPIFIIESLRISRENAYLPSSYLSDIWQPPRV
jgi:hypothetical protein